MLYPIYCRLKKGVDVFDENALYLLLRLCPGAKNIK